MFFVEFIFSAKVFTFEARKRLRDMNVPLWESLVCFFWLFNKNEVKGRFLGETKSFQFVKTKKLRKTLTAKTKQAQNIE